MIRWILFDFTSSDGGDCPDHFHTYQLPPEPRTRILCFLKLYFKIFAWVMALSAVATLTRCFPYSSHSFSRVNFKYIYRRRFIYRVSPHWQKQQTCNIMASLKNSVPEVSSTSQEKITAPYGSWKSPITADVVSGASKRLGGTAVDGNSRLIWLESRPIESGYR